MGAGWVKAPNGAPVYQDAGGLIHLKDALGETKAVKPSEAARFLKDELSGYSAASADDLNAAQAAAHQAALEAKSSTLGAAGRHLAAGTVGAALAIPKAVTALGSAAIGAEDPLARFSGRQFVEDAGAVATELSGGDGAEKAARDVREQILTDEAAHPYASMGAEMAGGVLGSGGFALAGKGAAALGLAGKASKVGAALGMGEKARKIAGAVGTGVLEGGAYGADVASEQAWVKDEKVTAEQSLAGIGLGGLFGGGLSAAVGVGAPALARLVGKRGAAATEGLEAAAAHLEGTEAGAVERAVTAAEERAAPAALENVPEGLMAKGRKFASGVADDLAVSHVARGQQAAMKALGRGEAASEEVIKRTGRILNESGIVGMGDDAASHARALAVKEADGAGIGRVMTHLDETAGAEAAPRLEDALTQIRSNITKTRNGAVTGSERRLASALEEEIAPIAERADARRLWNRDARTAMRGADALISQIEASPSAGMRAFAGKLRAGVTDAHKALEGGFADATHLTPVLDVVGKLQSAPSSAVRAQATELLEHIGGVAERADAAPRIGFADLHKVRRAVDDAIYDSPGGSKALKEGLKSVRGILEGELERAIGAADPKVAANYAMLKERYAVASWAEKWIGNRVGVKRNALRSISPSDYGTALTALVASGGNPLVSAATAVGHKFFRERGASIGAMLARKIAGESVNLAAAPAMALPSARALQATVAHSEESIGSSLSRFLGSGTESGPKRFRGSTALALRSTDPDTAQKAYQDHAREVQTVASMPGVASERLESITGKTLPAVAPGLHAQMAAVTGRAASYLSANMPAPPSDPNSITPHLDTPPPLSRADAHVYANRVEGVEDPLSMLEDLSNGYVSPEKVDAVKNVWPELYTSMRRNLFSQLAEAKSPVPYQKRQLLDMALGGNGTLEPSLRPASLAIMQQAGKAAAEAGQAKQQPSAAAPKLGNMLTTRSEQIAMR